ncbi:MAG: sulfotransferase, partial [Flavobacteriales bacterium]|nr:sulfotransferase [Flavobacteriales bacterium]
MARTKYIYILSQRYSGSTLLSFLLGTHPDIATIGERRKFYTHSFEQNQEYDQTCSCGKLFKECEHWNAIKQRVLEKVDIDKYKTNPTEFKLFANKHLHKLAFELMKFCALNQLPNPFTAKIKRLNKFNQILVEEIMKLSDGKLFLDSSKSLDQCFFLSQMKEIDLHVVWLTRDPRAQVNSAMKYNKWSVEEASNRWKSEMTENGKLLKKMKVNYTKLNYELLCRRPEAEMGRLLESIGIDTSSFSLNFREKTQHIMGNFNMRLGSETKIEE